MSETNKKISEKVLSKISIKWGNRPCPMCNSTKWIASDNVHELREFQGGNIVLGEGQVYPVVPVTCENCGNSVFVNPIVLGVMGTDGA